MDTQPRMTVTGFLEDAPRLTDDTPYLTDDAGAGGRALAFRIVHSPTDDPMAEAILPCLLPGCVLREESLADLYPAGTPVRATGLLIAEENRLLLVVAELEDLGAEPMPPGGQVLDIRTEGDLILATFQCEDDCAWTSVWRPDGTYVGAASKDNDLALLLALAKQTPAPEAPQPPAEPRQRQPRIRGSRPRHAVRAFKRRRNR
jgi:hypothetical protein